MDLKQAKLIGTGRTAQVFDIGNSQVAKVFEAWVPESKVRREFAATSAANALSLRVPRALRMERQEQRWAIIFERINGNSMLRIFQSRPWILLRGARQLAELHATLHENVAPPELPPLRTQMHRWIDQAKDLPITEHEAARKSLQSAPEGNALCHGDFHPDNILMGERGPVIIDWMSASRGHPLADVARTAHLIRSAPVPSSAPMHVHLLINLSRRLLVKSYLKSYCKRRSVRLVEIAFWEPIQLAASSAWRACKLIDPEDAPAPNN